MRLPRGGEARNFSVDFALSSGKVKWGRREGSPPFWLTMVRPSETPAPIFRRPMPPKNYNAKALGRVDQNQRFWAPWSRAFTL